MATEDEVTQDNFPGAGPPPWVVPVVTSIAAVVVGILIGGVFAWTMKPPVMEEVEIPRDYTEDELRAECSPFILEKTTEYEAVQSKVVVLSAEVKEKEKEVKDLEAEMARRLEKGKELIRELERAKAELKEVRAQLVVAQEEKKQLIEELKETVKQLEKTEVKLAKQVKHTERAKEDALVNKYHRFVGDSQLEICDRGMRKKMGKCREAVDGLLSQDKIRDAFSHCVRSGQATPSVHELPKKAELPEYAQYLNEEDKIVKGWYLLLCDPTLPEREDGFLNEDHLPATSAKVLDGDFQIEEEDDDI